MEIESLKVLHLDNTLSWRGGQQQTVYLFKDMLDQNLNTILVCQPDSEYQKFCEREHLPFVALHMQGEWDLIAGYKIAKICNKQHYHIIHAHSAHALTIAIWAKLFHRSLKLVAARRVDFSIKKSVLSRLKYRNWLVDKIICISNAIQEVMISDGIPENKLVTIHSGIDSQRYQKISASVTDLKKKLNIPDDHLTIGTVAALVGHKDYPTLMHAAQQIIKRYDQITFIAAGGGPREEELSKLHKELNLGSRFKFLGYRKDIADLLHVFDIFVLSSKKEGMGTSLLDAQSAGLPVVAAKAGGIPEIVQHGKNGLLFPPGDFIALADALSRLIDSQELRSFMGKYNQENIHKFDYAETVRKTLKLYQTLF